MEKNICDSLNPFNFIVSNLWIFSRNSTLLFKGCFTLWTQGPLGLEKKKKENDKYVKPPLVRTALLIKLKKNKTQNRKALKSQEN